jgi:hypothetical protein
MKKCLDPACGRLDDEIGQCGAPHMCPHRAGSPSVPADVDTSGRDVILSAGDLKRVVSVAQLITGRGTGINAFGEVSDKSQVRAHVPSGKKHAKAATTNDAKPAPASTTPVATGAETNGEQG